VNVHASLLPKYRGAAPIQWAIINGEKKTGITTMLMDEGLDTGDILLQEEMEIGEEDNAHTVALRLSGIGASLLYKTLDGLRKGCLRPVPQSGEPGYARPLKKEDGNIYWSWGARRIFNLIRGTFPWPGAYCRLGGERVIILSAKASEGTAGVAPGRIWRIDEKAVHIGTGKGILLVQEVKPEGKKAMSAVAFARGKRLNEGDSFDLS
jgi:methionyl-tRNA formyltransferase